MLLRAQTSTEAMMKVEVNEGDAGWSDRSWARVRDMSGSLACAGALQCHGSSGYLSGRCDSRFHGASCHEYVRVCESCERAPAAWLCKADAASLCAACDAEIHSANPLARRHQRVPLVPLSGAPYGSNLSQPGETTVNETEDDENEAASWLILDPGKNGGDQNSGYVFGGEADEYLDLVEYNSEIGNEFGDKLNQYQHVQHKNFLADSVVPVQYGDARDHLLDMKQHQNSQSSAIDFEASNDHYSFSDSMNHSVSVASVDAAVVPESTVRNALAPHTTRPTKGTVDLFTGPQVQMTPQLTPLDREARVLRYREKKKTRKFEKTIRYASRKAYAEIRPRIKGRFAKRTDVEVGVDQVLSSALLPEPGYGVVPSF